MAVLRLVAVMVPIGTLILRGAGQEGPGSPRPPTSQPWNRRRVSLGGAMGMGQPLQHPDQTLRSPVSSPHLQIHLTFPGAAEASLQAAAATILATPSTPAAMGAPQAHGTLGCLGTAQGATLRPPEQPAAAPCHAAQRQVGGAQALWAREGHRSDVGIPPTNTPLLGVEQTQEVPSYNFLPHSELRRTQRKMQRHTGTAGGRS